MNIINVTKYNQNYREEFSVLFIRMIASIVAMVEGRKIMLTG